MSRQVAPPSPGRRPSIHRHYTHQEPDQSQDTEEELNSEDETEDDEQIEEEIYERHGPQFNNETLLRKPYTRDLNASSSSSSSSNLFLGFILIVVIGSISALFFVQTESDDLIDARAPLRTTLEHLKADHGAQDEDLWWGISSAVSEISAMEQPRTLTLLYTNASERIVYQLALDMVGYAACEITSCGKSPVIMSHLRLNEEKYIDDYGNLIAEYRERLAQNGVLVIKNLEQVNGHTAQAFHSICDQYNPLVPKLLVIFTIKVDEFRGADNIQYLQAYFKDLWQQMEPDSFDALFTRIFNIVIEVRSP